VSSPADLLINVLFPDEPIINPTARRSLSGAHPLATTAMTRRQQLFALAAQLHELTTEEERDLYPFWDHLQDLIADLDQGDD